MPPKPDDPQQPPLFYWRPVPLMAATHGWMKVRPENHFGFSSRTNAVPLTVPEFVLAARHVPIIFIGPALVPSAVLGMRADQNLLVDDAGQWERGMYIPAYVRRYPFILLGRQTDQKLQLGIDDAGGTGMQGARPLFDGDKETQVVRDALGICEQFHNAFLFSQEFSAALKESGLIEERALEFRGADGKPINVGSFQAVNEQKFRDIDDNLASRWRKKGFLHAVYFHLQSLNNWDGLLDRSNRRQGNTA
jgi:hypothetical protein